MDAILFLFRVLKKATHNTKTKKIYVYLRKKLFFIEPCMYTNNHTGNYTGIKTCHENVEFNCFCFDFEKKIFLCFFTTHLHFHIARIIEKNDKTKQHKYFSFVIVSTTLYAIACFVFFIFD